jgi:hypothetical protein
MLGLTSSESRKVLHKRIVSADYERLSKKCGGSLVAVGSCALEMSVRKHQLSAGLASLALTNIDLSEC